jgi:hypothetical protein
MPAVTRHDNFIEAKTKRIAHEAVSFIESQMIHKQSHSEASQHYSQGCDVAHVSTINLSGNLL